MAKNKSEQAEQQLITNDMLDYKLDGISFSSKMKTKATKHDIQVVSTLELDYTGAKLRDVIGWSFKDRRIAQQNVMRNLGQEFIESTPVVSVIAVDIKTNGVRVDTSPEGLIAAGVAKGMTPEEIADAFLAKIEEHKKQRLALEKQRMEDEAELMDGVEVPSE